MRDHGRYIAIPGAKNHELPPLLVRYGTVAPHGDVLEQAARIVESEDMLPENDAGEDWIEQRKLDLAVTLAEEYRRLLAHWQWGDSILEWIRQCEITFESEAALRPLLHADVWPHAGRSSFVTLLVDKAVPTHGVGVEKAVGLRLTFRQPPPIDCFSNQFLFYLNSTVAGSAYTTWAQLNSDRDALLPPDRFFFQVLDLDQS